MLPSSRQRADAALLFVAAIWGLTFPLIRTALEDVDPARFLAVRFGVAVAAFAPLALARGSVRRALRRAAVPGLLLGLLAFLPYAAQTVALETAPAARVAFITGTHVVLVPLLSPLLRAGRPGPVDLVGAATALVGLWLLTDPAAGQLTGGDLWALVCAVGYAFYIHALHKALARGLDLTALAFLQVAGLALAAVFFLPLAPGRPVAWTGDVWIAVAFTALMATVGAFWLQTRYQGRTTPERTALIFVMEPVFALVFSFLLLGETFDLREGLGAGLILAAVIGVELWPRLRKARPAAEPA